MRWLTHASFRYFSIHVKLHNGKILEVSMLIGAILGACCLERFGTPLPSSVLHSLKALIPPSLERILPYQIPVMSLLLCGTVHTADPRDKKRPSANSMLHRHLSPQRDNSRVQQTSTRQYIIPAAARFPV